MLAQLLDSNNIKDDDENAPVIPVDFQQIHNSSPHSTYPPQKFTPSKRPTLLPPIYQSTSYQPETIPTYLNITHPTSSTTLNTNYRPTLSSEQPTSSPIFYQPITPFPLYHEPIVTLPALEYPLIDDIKQKNLNQENGRPPTYNPPITTYRPVPSLVSQVKNLNQETGRPPAYNPPITTYRPVPSLVSQVKFIFQPTR